MNNGLKLAASLLLACTASASLAQGMPQGTAGGYLFGGAGRSSYDVDCSGTVACDKSGSAARFGGGWRSASNIGFEGVILSFGKAKASVVEPGFGRIDADIKATAFGGGVAVFLPVGPSLELVGRLGLASVSGKSSGRALGVNVDLDSKRSAQAYAGVGLNWAFSKAVYLDLAFDATRVKVLDETGSVNALTVGVGVRF